MAVLRIRITEGCFDEVLNLGFLIVLVVAAGDDADMVELLDRAGSFNLSLFSSITDTRSVSESSPSRLGT